MAPITTDNCEFECATSGSSSNNTNNFENDIDNFESNNASRRSNEQSNEFDLNQVQAEAEDEQQQQEQQQQMPWEAPGKQGLYDPQNEHEACGVGFIVAIDGKRSHKVSSQASSHCILSLQSFLSLSRRFYVMPRPCQNG